MENLFPALERLNTPRARRQYIADRLVEMATDGTLFLTDIHNHDNPIPDMVGEVILGHDRDPQSQEQTRGHYVPQELLDYKVHIRAIPHLVQVDTETEIGRIVSKYEKRLEPIKFRFGSRVVNDYGTYEAAKRVARAWAAVDHWEPFYIDTGETDVKLPLQQAWFCLREQGKGVKRAKSRRLQQVYWKCEEVRPGTGNNTQTEGPRRGRPRKEAAE